MAVTRRLRAAATRGGPHAAVHTRRPSTHAGRPRAAVARATHLRLPEAAQLPPLLLGLEEKRRGEGCLAGVVDAKGALRSASVRRRAGEAALLALRLVRRGGLDGDSPRPCPAAAPGGDEGRDDDVLAEEARLREAAAGDHRPGDVILCRDLRHTYAAAGRGTPPVAAVRGIRNKL